MSTTLSDLIDIVQRQSNFVDPTYRERTRDAIMGAVNMFSERVAIPALLQYEKFLANGTSFYGFPERVRQIKSITDITNSVPVRPGDKWNRNQPVLWLQSTSAGTPYEFRDLGHQPVIAQPANETYITVQASVSEAQSVYVTGLARDTTASGTALEFHEVSETIVIGDETTQTSANQYVSLSQVQRSIDVGSATLRVEDVAGDKLLSRISPRERSPEYRRIEWLNNPAVGHPFRVEYYIKPDFLVDETAQISPGFDIEFLKWRAIGDMHWLKDEAQAAQLAWRKSDGILENFVFSELGQGEKKRSLQPDYQYGWMEGGRL